MYQIDNSTAVAAQPPSSAAGSAGFFTDGNPATNLAATIVPAEWLNSVMMELMNAIKGAGITPSKSAFNQLQQAINRAQGSHQSVIGVTANTQLTSANVGALIGCNAPGNYTLTLPPQTGLASGSSITFLHSTGN